MRQTLFTALATFIGALATLASSPTQAQPASALHVPSKTVLAATPSSYQVVVRDGFTTPGDAPELTYVASSSACTLGAGAGDGGSQVTTSDSKCWVANFASVGADVREWGVVISSSTSSDVALGKAATWATANAGTLTFPGGPISITGAQTVALNAESLLCTQGPPYTLASGGTLGQQGTTFWITSTTVQPFTIQSGVKISGCNYYWPNQNGTTPTVYKPLFTEPSGQQMGNDDFIGLRFINAYDFLDAANDTDPMGNLHFTDTYGYCINYCFSIAYVPETITISGMVIDSNLFGTVADAGSPPNLQSWTAANGAFLHVFGNGNGSTTASTVSVGAILANKLSVFGYRRGIWIDSTGALAESDISGLWDSVGEVFEADAGSCVAQIRMDGLYLSHIYLQSGNTDNYPTFSITNPATNCSVNQMDFAGQLGISNGDVLDVTGTHNNISSVSLSLQGGGSYGSSATVGPYYYANVSGTNLIFSAVRNMVQPSTADANHRGFLLSVGQVATLTSNTFNGVDNPIDPGSSAGNIVIAGNSSVSTFSTFVVPGSGGANIIATGNAFDKINPAVDGTLRLNKTILTSATASVSCTSGLGSTGTCALYTGSNSLDGVVTLSPSGTAPGATGALTLTFADAATNAMSCMFVAEEGNRELGGDARFGCRAGDFDDAISNLDQWRYGLDCGKDVQHRLPLHDALVD